ncbi:Aspartic peptidase A1 family protein [Dioscorea alata]|uniref:Aspartic peptidase A1 family protein n=1 Tax=Dioscorea alata TaxID=55571 RepID=A0ACB7UKM1_DIOAL|nr:Aspartic peptidase A1 family protein [Dioscorea alata]
MTHSRALSQLKGMKTLEVLDMIEPLRGFKDGYLMSLNLGTPPQVVQVFMDTGSDLIWVPCGNFSFECMQCDDFMNNKLVSSFYPSLSSSSFRDTCTSPLCTNIHSSDNTFDPCAIAGCSLTTIIKNTCPRPCPSFSYTYGGGGLVIGSLNRDTLRVHGSGGDLREVSSFCFGCVSSAFKEPLGLVGFGKGLLSFPSQVGFVHKGFSHCFLGFKFSNNPNFTSPLIIGDLAITSRDGFHFTPMLSNPIYPNLYYIGLESITVISNGNGNTSSSSSSSSLQLQVPLNLKSFDSGGNGGMLIDSGTTYTHLPEPLYSQLLSELSSKISYKRCSDIEVRSGFDLCFKVPVSDEVAGVMLPDISLRFLNDVELVLPKESCYYAISAPKEKMVVKCLLFQRMDQDDGEGYGPAGVFGSFQQQNVEVVYDLEKERIGFLPVDCASSAASHGLIH